MAYQPIRYVPYVLCSNSAHGTFNDSVKKCLLAVYSMMYSSKGVINKSLPCLYSHEPWESNERRTQHSNTDTNWSDAWCQQEQQMTLNQEVVKNVTEDTFSSPGVRSSPDEVVTEKLDRKQEERPRLSNQAREEQHTTTRFGECSRCGRSLGWKWPFPITGWDS